MPTTRFTFPGHGGHDLAARLDTPDRPHRAVALFAHCFTCGKDIAAARRIAARLTADGFAVLRFDFTGLGHSDGEFANTSYTSNVSDLVAAAAALEGRGMAPDLLVGHSLGGAAVLSAAARIPSARAVVTIGAPFDPGHVTHNFAAAIGRIMAEGEAVVPLGGRPIRIGRAFVEDVRAARLAPALAQLRKAILILHASRDETVALDNAGHIWSAARHPKSFVTLDDADHLLTRPEDAEYAAAVIAAWAARYLDLQDDPAPPGIPEGVTRVSEVDPSGFTQDVHAGRHHVTADEPRGIGADLGPSPYQLLAAGLGACTSMTVRMYARRKGWPLDHVSVDVSHDREHASDAKADAGGGEEMLHVFRREVRLAGELDPEQRQRLMQIADRCPVHRTLEAGARIDTVEVAVDPA
jgi:putative redox protein